MDFEPEAVLLAGGKEDGHSGVNYRMRTSTSWETLICLPNNQGLRVVASW